MDNFLLIRIFFHRRIYEEYGGPDENFHLALDLEYWLRIGKTKPFLRIPETLAAAREYPANKSQSNPLRQQTEALWAGYLHTGKFSNKRLWAIAGNRLLESGSSKDSPSFAIRKFLAYLKLRWEIKNKDYPWLHLPVEKPRQVT